MTTYEVMYNTCYGGFTIPDEVEARVFKEYPPHTEIVSLARARYWSRCF
jgi:hypothetical protein